MTRTERPKIVRQTPNIFNTVVLLWIGASIVGGVLIASSVRAEKELVDSVVAIVEDEAIFQSDVDQAVKQFLMQQRAEGVSVSDEANFRQEALTELINNKLVLAKANSLGITISFSEVESAVDRAIAENKRTLGGDEAFARQLETEGMTLDSLKKLYREQIHNRMLVERVLAAEIDRSSAEVTEAELHAAYLNKKSELPLRPSVVHLATIFVGLESSENAKSKSKEVIDDLHRRILAGENFATLAREYSEDPSAEAGGSLGSLKLSDLSNREFADAAASLGIGEVSEPVLTPFGYHLIQVTGMDSVTGEVAISHILIRVKAEELDVQDIFKIANDVHAELVEGAPFDSMATAHSTDAASAAKGGDLGWLKIGDLPEFFQDVLTEMKPGDISPVLREPSGFRIVKLLDRETTRPYEFAEVREELLELLQQEKLAGRYDGYLESLRSEFYVEMRTQ